MEKHLKMARFITDLLENKFGIGKFKFGFDPLIGAIPGFGDIFTLGFSLYLVWIGIKMKIPQEKIVEMVRNVILDFLIGLFPFLGDLADVVYRANSKNMKILETYAHSVVEGEVILNTV